ncbi:E-selectin-like [Branchiostoma floridae]|uniref:E-selectin-like n=1 Tax=Branchiostoma floridae TaxID=7739 RepID=A0A9J7LEW8_BRAFL|nr:E-selectin-like [Branchiostoma floridae]
MCYDYTAAVKCPDLSNPPYGNVTCDSGSNFRYPEACNFSCDPGYQLTPTSSSVRHCQADATWSGNDAECIGVRCPDLSRPTNGRMSCDNGSSFRHPETCTFTCNHGYRLTTGSNSISRTCRADGTWSGSTARCIVECPSLASPQNGGMTCTNRLENGRCTFTCNHGYHLQGSSEVVCGADGQWRGTPPSCAACDSAADIIFSIDVSGSVSGQFDTVRSFIYGVVNYLTIGGSHASVGVIKFAGSNANRCISLTDYNNKNDLLARIGSLDMSLGSTVGSVAGLSVMRTEFSTSGRPAARKIGIVLTDGRDTSSSDDVIWDAETLRNEGTTIFSVGVANIKRETLENMASRPVNENVFTAASFASLQSIVDSLRPKIWCGP